MKTLLALLLLPLTALGATTLAPGTYTVATCPSTPPVVTPPVPAGTSWVEHNGTFSWGGDWSWGTAAPPVYGPGGITVAIAQGTWGGYLPYAPGAARTFNLAPYKALIMSIQPSVKTQTFRVRFYSANDVEIGTIIDPVALGYCPALVVGQWSKCSMPLTAFNPNVSGQPILKFAVQEASGLAGTFMLNDIGFTP